jgi:tetratricopeptide (TPR) repeat protein
LALADWLVPVHYLRREVRFPQAKTARPPAKPSLDESLDRIRAAPSEAAGVQDALAAVDGVFVGRDDLFYQLEAAARLQRVVVLTGPGGTGKTELAKGFARWWRDTGGVDDPRLVFWHSFEPGIASFGLDGVITALGLDVFGTDFARLDPPQRLEEAKRLLAQYRVLLLWDNFESVREMPDPARATPPLDEPGSAALKGFLEWVRDHSCSAVLITSRAQETWLGQFRRIGIAGLNRAEAIQYAGHLLAPYPAAQRRRERRSFGDLLDWLDGHPLAMSLTLPRLDSADPYALLADLRGITPLSAADAPEADRTTSLAASITYSYAHLADQTRRLLPALSLFQGTADQDVLATFSNVEGVPDRFAGISHQEWSAALQDAVRVGLLTGLGAGMYRIHPALPGYLAAGWHAANPDGYDRERQACEQALFAACAAFSQWLTRQINSGDAAFAYALIGLQRRTLGSMLGHALGRQAWEDADCIVRALNPYWKTRGLGGEGAAWADRILDATVGPGQVPTGPAGRLWLYTTIEQANRQRDAGRLDQAGLTYRLALAYLQDQPANEWARGSIAVVYHQLGIIAVHRRRLDEAEGWYRQALAINTELGNRANMAATYHWLGVTVDQRGQLDEAEGWYRQALAINEEIGDRFGMALTYHQLGMIAHTRGDLDEAGEWYRQALAIKKELGDRPSMALTYHELGNTSLARGRLDEADEWYRKSLAINEEIGDRLGVAGTYHQLGVTAQARGRLDEAEDWYRHALAVGGELGDRPGMASTYHQLGVTAQARGRLDEAEDWYRQSLAVKEELASLPGMALTYGQLGLLAEDRQQPRQALERMVRCVALFPQFPHPLTGPGSRHLARLTRQLGMPALEETWQQVTGQPLPQAVRDYVTSRHDEQQPAGES